MEDAERPKEILIKLLVVQILILIHPICTDPWMLSQAKQQKPQPVSINR